MSGEARDENKRGKVEILMRPNRVQWLGEAGVFNSIGTYSMPRRRTFLPVNHKEGLGRILPKAIFHSRGLAMISARERLKAMWRFYFSAPRKKSILRDALKICDDL